MADRDYAHILRICLETLHRHPNELHLDQSDIAEILADRELKAEETK